MKKAHREGERQHKEGMKEDTMSKSMFKGKCKFLALADTAGRCLSLRPLSCAILEELGTRA